MTGRPAGAPWDGHDMVDNEAGSGERSRAALIGETLAERYVIEALVAEGGMGRVYRGTQRALDRRVAIKCIHPHLMTSPSAVSRFLEEARVASRLSHPNIVEIYDFGQTPPSEGGHFFLVMEYLEGRDLAQKLSEGPMPFTTAVDILGQMLSALGEAHASGVTHRDAKPENVILVPRRNGAERVKLIDFGIAKSTGSTRLTQTGTFVGSPNYMPPEQINGGTADVSADLYAVGAILFEALTGRLLFDDDNLVTVLHRQLSAPRPDPRDVAPERSIPEHLAKLCLRAIDIDPQKRYQTAEAFAEALESARRASVLPPPLDAPPETRKATSSARVLGVGSASTTGASLPPEVFTRSVVPRSVQLRYRVVQRASAFADLERLEQRASAAASRGQADRALKLMLEGVSRARDLLEQGEAELASAAFGSFGRRAAELLRESGEPEKARLLLVDVLDAPGIPPKPRARLNEQLVLACSELGLTIEAERARSEALRLARDADDAELVGRLSVRERAISGLRLEAEPPPEPPIRRSELRARRRLAAKLGRIDKAR